MENKKQAIELFDFIIEVSKSDLSGKDLFLGFRDKLQQLGFIIEEKSNYVSAFPELGENQACYTINVHKKPQLKKYLILSEQAKLFQELSIIGKFNEEIDNNNYEIVSESIGYILDSNPTFQRNFLHLIGNIIKRYIVFYSDEKKMEELITSYIECLNKLFPFAAPVLGNLNSNSKEIPDVVYSLQRQFIADAIGTLSFYCNTESALKLFINNFSKFRFTFDTFRDCFIIQKKEKSEFLYNVYLHEYANHATDLPPAFLNNKLREKYIEQIKENDTNNKNDNYQPDKLLNNYKNTVNNFSAIELEDFLSSCEEADLIFIQKLISSINTEIDEEYEQNRLKAFKECFNALIDNAVRLSDLLNETDIGKKSRKNSFIVLSDVFKEDLNNVTLENIHEFIEKYHLAEDGDFYLQVTCIDKVAEKYIDAASYKKYTLKNYSSVLMKAETFRDIIPGMLNYDEKPVNFFIDLYNEEFDKRINIFINKNIEKYKNYLDDAEESKKKVLSFFNSAMLNGKENNLLPLEEEYQRIKNNKDLIKVLVSSQIFKEDLDKNAQIYSALSGDFTLFVVGFIKAVERYLKLVHIQNPVFKKKLMLYNFDPETKNEKKYLYYDLKEDEDYVIAYADKNSKNPTGITIGPISESISNYLKQNSGIFKRGEAPYRFPKFEFKEEFINKIRNGRLHVKAIESYKEAQDTYKNTAYYFRKCIDDLNFVLKS